MFGGANGGIAPGGFRKFARGGIASSPTLGMIGEGRYNEAVVPLPDGKAIPVDMRSNAQNNNITVNISTDGSSRQSGDTDTEGLGRAVAKAVQEELQNQKRAGGILNRYGTA
jgi:phage-related minor tail protein